MIVQLKNGLIDLPDVGETFQCWLANFSDHAISLTQGQVVGVAEAQSVNHVCTVPPDSSVVTNWDDWEEIVRNQSKHLSPVELDSLLTILRPH